MPLCQRDAGRCHVLHQPCAQGLQGKVSKTSLNSVSEFVYCKISAHVPVLDIKQ